MKINICIGKFPPQALPWMWLPSLCYFYFVCGMSTCPRLSWLASSIYPITGTATCKSEIFNNNTWMNKNCSIVQTKTGFLLKSYRMLKTVVPSKWRTNLKIAHQKEFRLNMNTYQLGELVNIWDAVQLWCTLHALLHHGVTRHPDAGLEDHTSGSLSPPQVN